MDRLNIILVFLLSVFLNNTLLAKTEESHVTENNSINEKVLITVNSNVFLTGEKLYFSIHCINDNQPTELSKIAYVELINNSKQVTKREKLILNKGEAQGFIFIPSDFKTGNYKIVGYTNLMLNSASIELNAKNISIINIYQSYKQEQKPLSKINNVKVNIEDIIAYTSNKKIYDKRENIKLTLNDSFKINSQNVYSLKVSKKDSLSEYFNTISNTVIKPARKTVTRPIPEVRGEVITGKITSENKNISLKNIDLAISITNKTPFLKIIQTDHSGHFAFSIEEATENTNLFFQVLNDDYDKYTIEIDLPEYLDYSSITFDDFNLDTSLNKSLERRSIANQIENAYLESKKNESESTEKFKEIFPLDDIYNLDDFTRFKSLKEILKEIIPHAYYKKIGGKSTIQISDITTDYELSNPALIILDGIFIQDAEELFNYNFDNVKTIGVKRNGYYLGTKIFNGILLIETINNDYESTNNYIVKKEFQRPSQTISNYNPDYSNNSLSRIPDYRNQLLWLPNIDNQNNEISFYASDIEGVYEVVLEETNPNGESKFYTNTIEVK